MAGWLAGRVEAFARVLVQCLAEKDWGRGKRCAGWIKEVLSLRGQGARCHGRNVFLRHCKTLTVLRSSKPMEGRAHAAKDDDGLAKYSTRPESVWLAACAQAGSRPRPLLSAALDVDLMHQTH